MPSIVLLLAVCFVAAVGQSVPECSDPSKFNQTLESMLLTSTVMSPHIVAVQVAIPISTLWGFLVEGDLVAWNPLFNTISQPTEIELCGPLTATYSNGAFLANVIPSTAIQAPHYIVQYGCDSGLDTCAFGYFFTAITLDSGELLVYGRHTFTLYDNGDGTTSVTSFEKVAGPAVSEYVSDWNASLQESLVDLVTGVLCLERMYQNTGGLKDSSVGAFCTHFTP